MTSGGATNKDIKDSDIENMLQTAITDERKGPPIPPKPVPPQPKEDPGVLLAISVNVDANLHETEEAALNKVNVH